MVYIGTAIAAQLRRHFSCSTLTELIGETNLRRSTPEAYRKLREIVCTFERYGTLGNDIQLTAREIEANHVIMCLKMNMYNKGIADPTQFVPGFHIFEKLHQIRKSPLFRLLQKMPKGGALKTHDGSMCSTDYLIGLTYKEHLWACTTEDGCKIVKLLFSKDKPKIECPEDGKWEPMEKLRDRRGDENMRNYLKTLLSMYPMSQYASNSDAWKRLMSIFLLLEDVLRYQPVWAEYNYNALKEFSEDGVQYMEVRSLLRRLYTLEGEKLPVRETVQTYKDTLECFKQDHPDFIDSKLIYAPLRHVNAQTMSKYIKLCGELNKEFPNLLIGFDLVGQEDLGAPLSQFAHELIKLSPQIGFYFHAGQTNWFGSAVDDNLIDAVLLGTKRIGHGYAILKHPLVMYMAKKFGIALEVCPVCNQVLQLGADYRNHPAAVLIANDIPFVISSGNPSFWKTSPLSHDFYMVFLGIAPMNADLKFLKRICKNSLKYSALGDEAKADAMQKWKIKWDKWIEWIVENQAKIVEELK